MLSDDPFGDALPGDSEFDPFAADPVASPEEAEDGGVTTEEDPEESHDADTPIFLGGPVQTDQVDFAFSADPSFDQDGQVGDVEEVEDEQEEEQELGGAVVNMRPEGTEPTPLSLWEEKRKAELQEKREKALEAKRKVQEQAKKDLEEFYEARKELVAKNEKRNKKEEAEGLADLDSVMQFGTLWEKVARLVDLTPKAGQTYKRNDLTRMRSLLLQLKNEKPVEKK